MIPTPKPHNIPADIWKNSRPYALKAMPEPFGGWESAAPDDPKRKKFEAHWMRIARAVNDERECDRARVAQGLPSRNVLSQKEMGYG